MAVMNLGGQAMPTNLVVVYVVFGPGVPFLGAIICFSNSLLVYRLLP